MKPLHSELRALSLRKTWRTPTTRANPKQVNPAMFTDRDFVDTMTMQVLSQNVIR